jgi:hypothetical protein
VNNTQKLDDICRRIRLIETRMGIIQRACILVAEYVCGPVLITEQERKALHGDDAEIPGERGQEI